MEGIDFQPRTRLVFGPGCVARLGQLALELKATRALVVSDPGVVAAGHFERGVNALRQAGVEVCAVHGGRENPSTTEVAHGLSVAQDFQPNLLVGLGGGSSMDCAKGINFLFSCGGRMEDYWGVGKATGDMLPMIAVPTTSGTGSEAQSFALISQAETHVKMACGDPRAEIFFVCRRFRRRHSLPDRAARLHGRSGFRTDRSAGERAKALETPCRRSAAGRFYRRRCAG